MAAGARVNVEQVFAVAQIQVLINQVDKSLCPLAINGKITQKREFILCFCHMLI